jgi:hypothetical protein
VIVHYSYYNDGYTGSIQDLYISSIDMNVYDENGTAADTYPCTHDDDPKVCAVGTNCTASCAFILPANSDKIKINIEKYTSNGNGLKKAAYTLDLNQTTDTQQPELSEGDYKSNAAKVKDYILSNGKTSEQGYQYIETFSNTETNTNMILYMPDTDELVITAGTSTSAMGGTGYVFYNVSDGKVTGVSYHLEHYDLDFSYEAQASMDMSTYTSDTILDFTATSGDPYQYETETSFQETCNDGVKLAVQAGQVILLTNLNMNLSELGFAAY